MELLSTLGIVTIGFEGFLLVSGLIFSIAGLILEGRRRELGDCEAGGERPERTDGATKLLYFVDVFHSFLVFGLGSTLVVLSMLDDLNTVDSGVDLITLRATIIVTPLMYGVAKGIVDILRKVWMEQMKWIVVEMFVIYILPSLSVVGLMGYAMYEIVDGLEQRRIFVATTEFFSLMIATVPFLAYGLMWIMPLELVVWLLKRRRQRRVCPEVTPARYSPFEARVCCCLPPTEYAMQTVGFVVGILLATVLVVIYFVAAPEIALAVWDIDLRTDRIARFWYRLALSTAPAAIGLVVFGQEVIVRCIVVRHLQRQIDQEPWRSMTQEEITFKEANADHLG